MTDLRYRCRTFPSLLVFGALPAPWNRHPKHERGFPGADAGPTVAAEFYASLGQMVLDGANLNFAEIVLGDSSAGAVLTVGNRRRG
jgi:hypothetical protein